MTRLAVVAACGLAVVLACPAAASQDAPGGGNGGAGGGCEPAGYDVEQLLRFVEDLTGLLAEPGFVFVAGDEVNGVVTVAVVDPATQGPRARREADRLGIPRDAVCVVRSDGVRPVGDGPGLDGDDGSSAGPWVAAAGIVAAVAVVVVLVRRRRAPDAAGERTSRQ